MPATDMSMGLDGEAQMQPARSGEAVTPSNTVELSYVSRGLYVGAGGNVVAIMADGASLTFVGVPDGTLLPIRCKRIHATGTTASDMLALY